MILNPPKSGGRTVPTKRLFKENAPLIFFTLMGSFARTLFSRTLLPWPILWYSGQTLHARFSNTSFGRTLLGFNFGGLLLEQTFCRHFAARPPKQTAEKEIFLQKYAFFCRKKVKVHFLWKALTHWLVGLGLSGRIFLGITRGKGQRFIAYLSLVIARRVWTGRLRPTN